MYINKKVKFIYESNYIDSVYVFDDGDFILFGPKDESIKNFQELNTNIEQKYFSTLFDGKTLLPKLCMNVSSEHSFYFLGKDEFAIACGLTHFQICKFNSNRTSYTRIQTLGAKIGGTCINFRQIFNGDICITKMYTGFKGLYIYRKENENYGNNFSFYLEGIDDIINLNKDEILAYKKNIADDSLTLKIMNNNDYKIRIKNDIKFRDNIAGKRIYITLPFYKINDNKIITAGIQFLYIFGLDNLELETIIQFEKDIKNIFIRPKGNIFLLTELKEERKYEGVKYNEGNYYYYNQYINNIKIDFETNDLIFNKEENITKICGKNKSLFKLYNYINNGLITLIDKSKIIIYEDCDDI